MCLLGATHNVWCSIASAAVVGATVVGATAVNSVVIGADWCSSGFGVVSSVLYDAIVVQQWLAQQGVRSISWSSNSGYYLCVELRLNGASNRARLSVGALNCPVVRHTVRCMQNKARRCETLTEGDTMWQLVRKRT